MGTSEGEDASLVVPSDPNTAKINGNGEHALSSEANGACGDQSLSKLASGANVEPPPSEPVNDTNANFAVLEPVEDANVEPVASELANGANANSAASEIAIMNEGTSFLEPPPSEPVNDANANFAVLEPVEDANVEPVEDANAEPVEDANVEPVASELANGANANSAASEIAIMNEGTSFLEGDEKVFQGNEKSEDKFEVVQDELQICSTLDGKAKQQQKIKKKKMPGVACSKKVVSPAQKLKKGKMKMMQNEAKMEITKKKVKKIKKGMVTADATRTDVLNEEENVEGQKKLEVANVAKIESTPNEKSKKRKRGKKKKKSTHGDSGYVLAHDEEAKKDDVLNEKNVRPNELGKAKKKKKRMKQDTVPKDSDDPTLINADKPESPTVREASKEAKGLIFMCNSKTKQDCYRYNVFGLPASKKNIVAKVYDGMSLFLFDVDSKLLYGIYKAAGPGSYNIEPKAFRSAFPSQVRFHVLHDCLPVAEENFKAAIKDNYYSKNKFNCELTGEQVRALCKLFCAAKKPSKKRKQGARDTTIEEDSPITSDQYRKRSWVQGRVREPSSKGKRGNSWNKCTARSPLLDEHGERSHVQSRAIRVRSSLLDGDRFRHQYGRDPYAGHALPLPPSPIPPPYASPMLPLTNSLPLATYTSSVLTPPLPPLSHPSRMLSPLPPPSYVSTLAAPPAPSYGYEQASNVDYYRRDRLPDLHNRVRDPLPGLHYHRLSYEDPMPRTEIEYPDIRPRAVEYRDPYSMYRDPAPPREPLFPSALQAAYNPPSYRY